MLALHTHKKTALLALVSVAAILPVAIFATSNMLKSNDASALTHTIPDGYTTVVDPVFYDCVVETLGDSAIGGPTDEQLASITSLYCTGDGSNEIEDTTGLEKMTALTQLDLGYNNLSSIDLSKNTALTELYLDSNNLSSIDLSKNTTLTQLYLSFNNLSSIDVSKNTALTQLDLVDNNLFSIGVSNNTTLTQLNLGYNNLSSIDVSNNTALTELYLYYNNLSSIDVSNNTALEYLDLSNNAIFDFSSARNLNLTSKNFRNQKGTTTINTDTYYYRLLSPLFNQVKDREWVGMYTGQAFKLVNASTGGYSDRVRIIDLSKPATIKIVGGAADGSILTINHVPTYTLSFSAIDGTNVPATLMYIPTDNEPHEFIIPDTEPIRPGYVFLGWANAPTATVATMHAGDSVPFPMSDSAPVYIDQWGSATLYAVWGVKFTLNFDANGGSGTIAAQECIIPIPGAPPSRSISIISDIGPVAGCAVAVSDAEPTRQGYTFLGWAESSDADSAIFHAGDNVEIFGNEILFAVWELEPEPEPTPEPEPEPEPTPEPEPEPEPTPEPEPEPEPEILTPDTGFNTSDSNNNIGQNPIAILGALATDISVTVYGISRIITRRKTSKS